MGWLYVRKDEMREVEIGGNTFFFSALADLKAKREAKKGRTRVNEPSRSGPLKRNPRHRRRSLLLFNSFTF